MRDKGTIFVGLFVFLALITFPVWYNLVAGEESRPPEIALPPEGGKCVADADTMRTDHMQLLIRWRDDVVRDNDRIHTTSDGRRFYKSLTGTCLNCHTDKDEFCIKCHNYVSVSPSCWECHVDPKGVQ